MEYVLLVTWLIGSNASHYQVEFSTEALCFAAATKLIRGDGHAVQFNGDRATQMATMQATCVKRMENTKLGKGS